jgi:phosphonate transport system substrate-binding protein
MKNIFKKYGLAPALAVSSLLLVVPTTAASAKVVSVKVGGSCLQSQYGKTVTSASKKFKCTYNSKTKKYTWSAVNAAAGAAKTIDLTKLDKTGWPKRFVVGGVPAENVTTMQTKWGGLIQLFKDELGIEVDFYPGSSYAGVIEASIANKVDLVAWGAMSYIVAKVNGARIEPVGITKYVDGTTSYNSRLLTKTSQTGITKIADVKGKKVCFVSTTSTSGGLIPTEGLLAAGLTSADYTTVLAGTHDNSLLKLASGDCDASFMQEATAAAIGTGTFAAIDKATIKEVWKSGEIPNGPFTIRQTLPASLRAAVKNIMLTKLNKKYFTEKGYNGCTSESTCIIVEDKNTNSFITVADSFYDTIRKVCEATKSTACKA